VSESLFRRLLLILLLVVAQAGAQAHAISHLAETHHDQAPHDEPVCEQCLAYGQVGAGLPSVSQPLPEPAPFIPTAVAPTGVATPPSTPAYQSRAPQR
jgi:hypothetical protein